MAGRTFADVQPLAASKALEQYPEVARSYHQISILVRHLFVTGAFAKRYPAIAPRMAVKPPSRSKQMAAMMARAMTVPAIIFTFMLSLSSKRLRLKGWPNSYG